MKIAVVGPFPPHRGGISHYGASLVNSLRVMGHDVLPLGFRKLYPDFLFPGESELDTSLTPLPDAVRELVAYLPWTWSSARKHLKGFEVEGMVLQLWHPFFVPLLRYLQSKVNRNVVIAHNILPHEKQTLGRIFNPGLLRNADKVFVGTSEEQQKLRALTPGVASEIAPHPVYDRLLEDKNPDGQNAARTALGLDHDGPLLVHIGLVRKYKGTDLLIRAFHELGRSDALLLIAGEFYDDPGPYMDLVKHGSASDRIKVESRYLSDREMALFLQAADALVLPYRHVTQSGMAMSALALGTPVLGTNVGGMGELIEDGMNGLLAQPEDVVELCNVMDRFISNVNGWRSKRDQIASRAADKFSWQNLAERIISALQSS
jgi:glycosyltransferase involved in cell wall biosynthesis